MVQLPHPYMTIGKTIALSIRTFIGKVISLLFNTLSRFIIVLWINEKIWVSHTLGMLLKNRVIAGLSGHIYFYPPFYPISWPRPFLQVCPFFRRCREGLSPKHSLAAHAGLEHAAAQCPHSECCLPVSTWTWRYQSSLKSPFMAVWPHPWQQRGRLFT